MRDTVRRGSAQDQPRIEHQKRVLRPPRCLRENAAMGATVALVWRTMMGTIQTSIDPQNGRSGGNFEFFALGQAKSRDFGRLSGILGRVTLGGGVTAGPALRVIFGHNYRRRHPGVTRYAVTSRGTTV